MIVYCSGQARGAPSGDILLVPHDGRTATEHLYPLKNMESALAKLKTKQILFIFDGLVIRLSPKAHAKPAERHRLIDEDGSWAQLAGFDRTESGAGIRSSPLSEHSH